MTERPTTYLIGFTNPLPGHEQAFNEWYDTVHLKEVTMIDGVLSGRRFKLFDVQMPNVPRNYQYAVMYEIETGKERQVIDAIVTGMSSMQIDPVVDLSDFPNFLIGSIGDTLHR